MNLREIGADLIEGPFLYGTFRNYARAEEVTFVERQNPDDLSYAPNFPKKNFVLGLAAIVLGDIAVLNGLDILSLGPIELTPTGATGFSIAGYGLGLTANTGLREYTRTMQTRNTITDK